MKRGLFALLALVVLVLVALIAFLLGRGRAAVIPPTPTLYVIPTTQPTAQTTITRAASSTPKPSNTPQDTSTLTPTATPTITPTLTLTPTLTASATPTSDNRVLTNYANPRDDIAYYLRDVKADIDPTFGKFIEGKVSQYDESWQYEMELYFSQFDVGVTEMLELSAPEPFVQSHLLTVTGVQACSRGFWALYNGALAQDNDIYQLGVGEIAACNRDWNAGDYAFWDVVLEHGLTWPAMSSPTLAP